MNGPADGGGRKGETKNKRKLEKQKELGREGGREGQFEETTSGGWTERIPLSWDCCTLAQLVSPPPVLLLHLVRQDEMKHDTQNYDVTP